MDGEDNAKDSRKLQEQSELQQPMSDAQLAQEEAFLEAQA